VWSVREFDASFEPVGTSVLFRHASPDSVPFRVESDIFPALLDHWAGVTNGFCPFHLRSVATVEEEQVGSAFARCSVCPGVEEVGVLVGLVHS
jgi:hypothetical protein